MKRELKFRVWNGHKMVSPSGFQHISFFDDSSGTICDAAGEAIEHFGRNEAPAMQFTGLHDKNGNEIYEGDVLQSTGFNFEIKWIKQNAGFWADYRNYSFDPNNWDKGIVVGNIYENPELLEPR